MESIQQSIVQLSEQFNAQMAEFQKNLQSASIPATSPTSNIAAQFSIFRSFVLNSLEGLQRQVEILSKQCDQIEMRSRHKILLLHGIPETKDEVVAATVVGELAKYYKISDLTVDTVSRCHRMGTINPDKPRAILVKFKDLSLRNQIWFSKTCLKNSGVTVSEFLTKDRYNTFLGARQRFGVNKCWTKAGRIVIITPNGKRHYITTRTELESISCTTGSDSQKAPTPSGADGSMKHNSKEVKTVQSSHVQAARSKRNIKNK